MRGGQVLRRAEADGRDDIKARFNSDLDVDLTGSLILSRCLRRQAANNESRLQCERVYIEDGSPPITGSLSLDLECSNTLDL